MVVAVALVKGMCAVTNDVGAYRHPFATFGARPSLRRLEQLRARTVAALAVRYDQSVYLCAPRDFQKRGYADMNPADDQLVYFREEYGVLRRRFELRETRLDFLGCGWIAELAAQFGDARSVGLFRPV